jgi:hypothetical protein
VDKSIEGCHHVSRVNSMTTFLIKYVFCVRVMLLVTIALFEIAQGLSAQNTAAISTISDTTGSKPTTAASAARRPDTANALVAASKQSDTAHFVSGKTAAKDSDRTFASLFSDPNKSSPIALSFLVIIAIVGIFTGAMFTFVVENAKVQRLRKELGVAHAANALSVERRAPQGGVGYTGLAAMIAALSTLLGTLFVAFNTYQGTQLKSFQKANATYESLLTFRAGQWDSLPAISEPPRRSRHATELLQWASYDIDCTRLDSLFYNGDAPAILTCPRGKVTIALTKRSRILLVPVVLPRVDVRSPEQER